MQRREFVRRLPVATSGVIAGVSALASGACAGTAYLVPGVRPGALVVPTRALPPGGDLFVQGPGMDRPVYLHRDPAGDVVALLASCTHQGCQPEPLGDRLACPCHGSEFALDGSVLEGPAERPLTRYPVTLDGDDLIVRLGAGGAR